MKTTKARKQKRAAAVALQRLVRMRFSVTPKEAEVLLRLLRYCANEPSDVDALEFLSLKEKVESALAHPNDHHQRWEPAANDVWVAADLTGWLPSAA
jgi:predicted RNA-binding protein with EMAP domain